MMSTRKLLSKAKLLSDSLDELEAKLEPILSHSLEENLASLDTIQQAKLNVLLPYLINDLIFIYLKTRGIDPKTHPVVAELNRVRDYFAKINSAEEIEKKKMTSIDRAAAGRFIKHAIAQAKQNTDANDNSAEAGPSQPSTFVPARVTEKMKEREAYLQSLKNDSESEEQVLEVIDGDNNTSGDLEGTGTADKEQKGKKRRRPMDPFGSIGDQDTDIDSTETPTKNRKLTEVIGEDTGASSRSSPISNADDTGTMREKTRKKKKKSKKV